MCVYQQIDEVDFVMYRMIDKCTKAVHTANTEHQDSTIDKVTTYVSRKIGTGDPWQSCICRMDHTEK